MWRQIIMDVATKTLQYNTGKVPRDWKAIILIPIFKKGDILSLFKIEERLKIADKQWGFRKNCSNIDGDLYNNGDILNII